MQTIFPIDEAAKMHDFGVRTDVEAVFSSVQGVFLAVEGFLPPFRASRRGGGQPFLSRLQAHALALSVPNEQHGTVRMEGALSPDEKEADTLLDEEFMSRIKTVPSDRLEAEIFEHLDLGSEDPLVLIKGGDFVLVKRAVAPALLDRFDKLACDTRERFEKIGAEPDDVERAVRWARDSS